MRQSHTIIVFFVGLVALNVSAEILDVYKLIPSVLENNFDIQISNSKTNESKSNFEKQYGKFDISLSLKSTYTNSDTPSSSTLDGGGSASSVKSKNINQSLTLKKVFITGTEVSLPYTYNIVDSESSYRLLKKTHEPNLKATIKQPLLIPFWNGYVKKDLIEAEFSWKAQIENNQQEILNKVYEAIEKYYGYLESIKLLKTYENAFVISSENLSFIKDKQKAGQGSLIDVLDATSSNNRAKDRMLKQKFAHFKIQNELNEIVLGKKVAESEKLEFVEANGIIELWGLGQKNDILPGKNHVGVKEKEINVEKQKKKEFFSGADLYPDIDLTFEYGSYGVQESLSKGNQEIVDQKFPTWKVSLGVEQNVFRHSEKGNENINKHKTEQEIIKRDAYVRDIALEMKIAVLDINMQKAILESLDSTYQAESTKMEFYQKQFHLGQLSAFDLEKNADIKINAEIELTKANYTLQKKILKYFKEDGSLFEKLSLKL